MKNVKKQSENILQLQQIVCGYSPHINNIVFYLIEVLYVILSDIQFRQVLAVLKVHQGTDVVHAEKNKMHEEL